MGADECPGLLLAARSMLSIALDRLAVIEIDGCGHCHELEAQLAAARSALAACREVAGKRAGGDA